MEEITATKPTLQMINSQEVRPIEEWEEMYPELWLFIEVMREDIHRVYEGRLIATAADSMEFIEIGRLYRSRGTVNLTTRGIPLGPHPIGIPTCNVA